MRPRAYAQRSQKEVPQMQSSLKGTPHFLYSVYKFKRKRKIFLYYPIENGREIVGDIILKFVSKSQLKMNYCENFILVLSLAIYTYN